MPDVRRERVRLLVQLERVLEPAMLLLGLLWLVLLVIELTRGLSPALQGLGTAVWVAFIADFVVRGVVAPSKLIFLRRNWVTALSLALPAVRLARAARVLRVARIGRGVRLAKILAAVNRGIRSSRRAMRRRGLSYVALLSAMVVFAGAAGMMAFEGGPNGPEVFSGYGSALWWTAMLVTTMGSDAWPRTAEGRILCLVLATYSFAIFGYITASLASWLVDRDRAAEPGRSS